MYLTGSRTFLELSQNLMARSAAWNLPCTQIFTVQQPARCQDLKLASPHRDGEMCEMKLASCDRSCDPLLAFLQHLPSLFLLSRLALRCGMHAAAAVSIFYFMGSWGRVSVRSLRSTIRINLVCKCPHVYMFLALCDWVQQGVVRCSAQARG